MVLNTERVLAIEPAQCGTGPRVPPSAAFFEAHRGSAGEHRKHVPFVENDQVMYTLIDASVKFLQTEKL